MPPKTLDYKKLLHARTLLRQTAALFSEEPLLGDVAAYLTDGHDTSCFQDDGQCRRLPNTLAGTWWTRLGDYAREQRTPYDRSCIEAVRELLGSLTDKSGFKYWLRAEMAWGYTCREDYGKTFCRTGDKHMISLYLFKTEKDASTQRTKMQHRHTLKNLKPLVQETVGT